jgi:UDP-glucose 4-epimerase
MWEKTKVIGTTGPEMRRFFFTVNEAVALVNAAIENIEDVHGKVLSREMKSAQIEDILKVWVETKGGKWEKIEGRPGERTDEFLVGDIELPYTQEKFYNGIKHFLISFNQKVEVPVTSVVSSANAQKLSREEIIALISDPEKYV